MRWVCAIPPLWCPWTLDWVSPTSLVTLAGPLQAQECPLGSLHRHIKLDPDLSDLS